MRATRAVDLLATAACTAVASWLIVRVAYGDLPAVTWWASASLYLIAIAEVVGGFRIRGSIADSRIGDGPGLLHPLMVARTLALAKASAWVGAIAAGVWAGYLVHVSGHRSELTAAADDFPGVVAGVLAGVVLAGAALWLERCCTAPTPPSDSGPASE